MTRTDALPGPALGAHWAAEHHTPVVAHGWGVPLVRSGRVVRNAGGGSTPGVLVATGSPPPPLADLDADALVVHDLVDLDGAVESVAGALPSPTVVHRYDAGRCDFGSDPARFAEQHLSAKRRKRIRADERRLAERGAVTAGWLTPAATGGAGFRDTGAVRARFRELVTDRAAATGRWDAAVADADAGRRLWDAVAGGELQVHVLAVGGVAVSIRTGFVVGSRFVGLTPIVDRSIDKVSLGDVHMRRLLDELAAVDVATYLMGKGGSEHKDTWATGEYRMVGVVARLGDGGRARAVAAAEIARQHARRQLTVRGLEDPLRRALHRWHRLRTPDYRAAIAARAPGSSGS